MTVKLILLKSGEDIIADVTEMIVGENEDKKVIAPNQWFGKDGYTKNHDTSDMIPNGWTRI